MAEEWQKVVCYLEVVGPPYHDYHHVDHYLHEDLRGMVPGT